MIGSVRRIGLIGGECSGKSTLAEDLGQSLPACVVGEHLRVFVEQSHRNPLAHEQRAIMTTQHIAEDAAATGCPFGTVITDSAPLMIAVYSQFYFGDSSLLNDAVAWSRNYDLVLWCDIDMPWHPDGIQRDGPQVRAAEHELIANIVRTHLQPAGVPVQLVSGSRHARAVAAARAWRLLGLGEPT